MNAAKIVSSAILGVDFKVAFVNNKSYVINPPTIKKIAGAGYYLSEIKDGKTIGETLKTLGAAEAAHALSWMIKGDDSLYKELSEGTYGEVVDALDTAYSLVSAQDFFKLSDLARNVASLIAKQKL